MISINASYTNLVNQRTLATNTKNLHKATERLSTGMKINHANDDAAGLFVGSALASSISSRKIALDNTMLASNFLNIADGALSNVSANLNRMNELAIQACNGFMSTEAREALQNELNTLAEQANQTISGATMNGVSTIKNDSSGGFIGAIDQKSEKYLIDKEHCVECNADNLAIAGNKNFYINSVDQLQALATFTNNGGTTSGRTFVLSANIDLSSVCSEEKGSWTTIGTNSKLFQGTFDGNGHVVSNLYINKSGTANQGLFGYTSGSSTITNLGVENANVTGNNNTGCIVGAVYGGVVDNCYATGTVNGVDNVGCLLGYAHTSSKIKKSHAAGEASGNNYIGGLIGSIYQNVSVTCCYSTGNVTGTKWAGGLTGGSSNGSQIANCYATGNVNCEKTAGGLLGAGSNATVTNCYATGDVTGGTHHFGGLVGGTGGSLTVKNSYATGSVDESLEYCGLLGEGGTITNCYSVHPDEYADATQETFNRDALLVDNWDDGYNQSEIWDISRANPILKFGGGGFTAEPIMFQINDGYDENSSISYNGSISLNLNNFDLSNIESARESLQKIQDLLTTVTEKQSYIGTQLNRLTNIATASQMTIENYSAAKSTVMDTDIAQETANMVKSQILQQISVSVLSQSKNVTGQIALSLIG